MIATWDEVGDEVSIVDLPLPAIADRDQMIFELNNNISKSLDDTGLHEGEVGDDDIFHEWKTAQHGDYLIAAGPFTDQDHHAVLLIGPDPLTILEAAAEGLMAIDRDADAMVKHIINQLNTSN